MNDNLIPIVVVGSVDHGKSTFIGRLLHDTGQLTPDRLQDLEDAGRALNRKVEYAHVTDQFQEEREANITIDTTQTLFRSQDRTYLLIDAPGHREYLTNMITGASRARAALLMLDVSEGIRAQTEKHADILKLLGIEKLAVFINKMDLIDYKSDVYAQHRALIEESLATRNLKAAAIIPLAAYHGENVIARSTKMPWYKGPTALEFIESCGHEPVQATAIHARFPVQMLHIVNGTRLVLGRVEQGVLEESRSVRVFPTGEAVRIKRIHVYGEKSPTQVGAGECVALEVDSTDSIRRGMILVGEEKVPSTPKQIEADVVWAHQKSLHAGDEFTLECRTQAAAGRALQISECETNATLANLDHGAIGRVRFELADPFYVRPHAESDIFGRLVFHRGGEVVGCGIVTKILSESEK